MFVVRETHDTDRGTQINAAKLGYAGLVPFIVGVCLVWLTPALVPAVFASQAIHWVLIYGAVILSFMGGARWGAAIQHGRPTQLVTSIIPAIIGWLSVVPAGVIPGFAPSDAIRFSILMVSFVALLITELFARQWARWYTVLRVKLSLMTATLLFLMALGSVY